MPRKKLEGGKANPRSTKGAKRTISPVSSQEFGLCRWDATARCPSLAAGFLPQAGEDPFRGPSTASTHPPPQSCCSPAAIARSGPSGYASSRDRRRSLMASSREMSQGPSLAFPWEFVEERLRSGSGELGVFSAIDFVGILAGFTRGGRIGFEAKQIYFTQRPEQKRLNK